MKKRFETADFAVMRASHLMLAIIFTHVVFIVLNFQLRVLMNIQQEETVFCVMNMVYLPQLVIGLLCYYPMKHTARAFLQHKELVYVGFIISLTMDCLVLFLIVYLVCFLMHLILHQLA